MGADRMRILDENDNEVLNPDYELGYCLPETIVVAHHEAQEYIQEQFHYEIIASYPNGGKEIAKVVDVQEQEARAAWDETETILRWHLKDSTSPSLDLYMTLQVNVSSGERFNVNGGFYVAIESIPAGVVARPNINCVEITLDDVLNEVIS